MNNLFDLSTVNKKRNFQSVHDDEILNNLQIKYNPMIDKFKD